MIKIIINTNSSHAQFSLALHKVFSLALLSFALLCPLSLSPFTTPSRLSILLCFDLGLISQVYRGFAGFFSFFGSVKLGAIISIFFFFCYSTKKYGKWYGNIKKWCGNSTV